MKKRTILTLLLIFALMIPMRLAGYGTNNTLKGLQRTGIYALETLVAGIGGTCGMYVGGSILLTYDPLERWFLKGNYHFALCISPFIGMGATAGVTFMGNLLGQRGSPTGTLIGSVIGATLPYFVWRIYSDVYSRSPSSFPEDDVYLIINPIIPCASIGAVIGYNYELLKSDKRELLYCGGTCATLLFLYEMALLGKLDFLKHFP